jgi:hypothetical protein
MASFYQRGRGPGFWIDTSSSMDDSQLARAAAELGGLTRQLKHGADVVVALRCRRAHGGAFGGAGRVVWRRRHRHRRRDSRAVERKIDPIDLLVIVTDCRTPWPEKVPPFPVITIRVGDGMPPPWGNRGANRVITLVEPDVASGTTRRK